jgi:hypothetical protein
VVEWLLSAAPAAPAVSAQLLWLDLEGRSLAQLTRMGGHEDLACELESRATAIASAHKAPLDGSCQSVCTKMSFGSFRLAIGLACAALVAGLLGASNARALERRLCSDKT